MRVIGYTTANELLYELSADYTIMVLNLSCKNKKMIYYDRKNR